MTLAAPAEITDNRDAVEAGRHSRTRLLAPEKLRLRGLFLTLAGILLLIGIWWLAGTLLVQNPQAAAFTGLAPGPAFARLLRMIGSGEAWRMTEPSLGRVPRRPAVRHYIWNSCRHADWAFTYLGTDH
jgi:hypothetical protein